MPQVEIVPHGSKKPVATIGAGVAGVILVAIVIAAVMWLNRPKPKSTLPITRVVTPKNTTYYAVVSAADVAKAHETLAAEGTVQSFDGKTIGFLANGSKQTLKLVVTPSTRYTKGASYAPAQASGLKGGSRAIVTYNSRTNEVMSVAYDL